MCTKKQMTELLERVRQLEDRVQELETTVLLLQADEPEPCLMALPHLVCESTANLIWKRWEKAHHRGQRAAYDGLPPEEPSAPYLEGWCETMATDDWSPCVCGHAICEHDPAGVCCDRKCTCRKPTPGGYERHS